MQNVEHAVGHHHFLAALARLLDRDFKLRFVHDAEALFRTRMNGVFQLDRTDGRSAQLADHNPCRRVRHKAGILKGVACRQGRRQHADHGIARAGYVEHFLRLRRQMQRRFARLQQRHAVFRARHQQRGELIIRHQLHAAADDLLFVFTFADHRFELRQVRRQQRGAAIALEVGAFGIDQHRHLRLARQANHGLHAGERPFRIVGEHQRAGCRQRLTQALMDRLRIDLLEPLFEIEAQQLLVARQHAQFGNGGMGFDRHEVTANVDVFQRFAQHASQRCQLAITVCRSAAKASGST